MAPPIEDNWISVSSICGFEFRAPPDLVETKVQGTDSCVVQYAAVGCRFSGDYGFYSGSFDSSAGQPNFREIAAEIDGQEASLVTFGPTDPPQLYFAGVHFPQLPEGAGVKLTFVAECDSVNAQTMAVQVYRTLCFER